MSKNDYLIPLERKEDYREVENLVRESFWNVYRPGCLEHYVLNKMRNHPDFIPELDFVMEKDGKILLDYSLGKATELGFGAVCFGGNIEFYGKSGFTFAGEFGIRYHGLPEGILAKKMSQQTICLLAHWREMKRFLLISYPLTLTLQNTRFSLIVVLIYCNLTKRL